MSARPAGRPSLRATLFLQMNRVGDSLVMAPMFEAVKRASPDNRVYVVGTPQAAEIYRNNPFVDGLVATRDDPQTSRRALLRYARLCRRQIGAWGISTVVCDVVNTGPWPAVLLRLLPRRVTRVVSKAVPRQALLCRGYVHVNADVDVDAARDGSVLDYNRRVLAALGCPTDGLRVRVYPSADERARARAHVDALGLDPARPTVAFAPYTMKQATAWPLAAARAFVAAAAARYNLLAVGGPADAERWARDFGDLGARAFPLFGLNIREASVAIARADLLVALNTGVSHLFHAIDIPMLRIDGGHSPRQLWAYEGDPRYHAILHPVPCSPCFRGACPLPDHPCMSGITADQVLARVAELLRTGARGSVVRRPLAVLRAG